MTESAGNTLPKIRRDGVILESATVPTDIRFGLPLEGCSAPRAIKGLHERNARGICGLCGDGPLLLPAMALAETESLSVPSHDDMQLQEAADRGLDSIVEEHAQPLCPDPAEQPRKFRVGDSVVVTHVPKTGEAEHLGARKGMRGTIEPIENSEHASAAAKHALVLFKIDGYVFWWSEEHLEHAAKYDAEQVAEAERMSLPAEGWMVDGTRGDESTKKGDTEPAHQSRSTAPHNRYCIGCAHLYYSEKETDTGSTVTGSWTVEEASMSCRKGHWQQFLETGAVSFDLESAMETAAKCPDFEEREGEESDYATPVMRFSGAALVFALSFGGAIGFLIGLWAAIRAGG